MQPWKDVMGGMHVRRVQGAGCPGGFELWSPVARLHLSVACPIWEFVTTCKSCLPECIYRRTYMYIYMSLRASSCLDERCYVYSKKQTL